MNCQLCNKKAKYGDFCGVHKNACSYEGCKHRCMKERCMRHNEKTLEYHRRYMRERRRINKNLKNKNNMEIG